MSVFQTLIMQSCDPEIVLSPSLVTETADTFLVCPDKVWINSPVCKCQNLIVKYCSEQNIVKYTYNTNHPQLKWYTCCGGGVEATCA